MPVPFMCVAVRVRSGFVAMIVVVAVMPMIVVVAMTMRMTVATVAVTMGAAGIGAAERVERLHDLAHHGAQPFEHRLDDMVAQDEDPLGLDRGGEVAVADVPGEAGEMDRIAAADLEQVPRRPR